MQWRLSVQVNGSNRVVVDGIEMTRDRPKQIWIVSEKGYDKHINLHR